MTGLNNLELLFLIWAFLFQIILIIHFALRRWAFDRYTHKYGWIVYAFSIPAALISVILLADGMDWSYWLAGFLYLIWAIFGYWVEYVRKIQWRNPPRWPVLLPYLLLYLSTIMFYWFPLGNLYRPLWYVYAILFLISTILNITSHRKPASIGSV